MQTSRRLKDTEREKNARKRGERRERPPTTIQCTITRHVQLCTRLASANNARVMPLLAPSQQIYRVGSFLSYFRLLLLFSPRPTRKHTARRRILIKFRARPPPEQTQTAPRTCEDRARAIPGRSGPVLGGSPRECGWVKPPNYVCSVYHTVRIVVVIIVIVLFIDVYFFFPFLLSSDTAARLFVAPLSRRSHRSRGPRVPRRSDGEQWPSRKNRVLTRG